MTAGLLLCARRVGERLELPVPSVLEILSATHATRSCAYEIAAELRTLLPALARPPGRPRAERAEPPASALSQIQREALRFLMRHPGCARIEGERARYGDAWRLFVIELRDRNPEVSLGDLAEAICTPLGTVEDWLRAPRPEVAERPPVPDNDEAHEGDPVIAQVETVLAAWRGWHGDLGAFCEHVRREHRIELGTSAIARILFEHGARQLARRPRRCRDEHAVRGAFETFFPDAHWVGDGKQLQVVVDGKVFRSNLELVVDAATDAAVGVAVTDEEDSQAVADAMKSGAETTGQAPLAVLLDNRPSNHTPEVDAALGDTMRIRATEGRPQNKAHVEGAFGLFAQKVPPIELCTREPGELARAVATVVALTFFRALNRAPRRDRGGQSRADLYAQDVTAEQRDAARAALRERLRRQELARQTRAARLDPLVRAHLDDAFVRLGLCDPERHVRDAIACYPRDAIVDALAIFAGKRERGSLPADADARYLLGITRNLHHVHQADAITEALLRERLDARDRFLAPLVRDRDDLLARRLDAPLALDAIVDRLVHADREVDRHFWIGAAAALVAARDAAEHRDLARRAARRIHATFRLPLRERDRLERLLLRRLWPLA
ncbi:MAG: transposase family protein [Deltaproteobacteria bacterium]|nr:transposase family protein [Deltaproteobacteria bacterium]